MKIWKLLSAIVVTIALFVCLPYVLARLGFMTALHPHAWLILTVTALGLLLKTIFGDLVAGEFHYYKHGDDFCVITLGASLSRFSLQPVSDKDLFPGLPIVPVT